MATVTTNFPIGPESAGILMTPEEFDRLDACDENYRYELVHHVLTVDALAEDAEAAANELLSNMLFVYQRQHPQGSSLDATLRERHIHLPHSRRRADRVIWCGLGRHPSPKTDIPRITVEFVSKGKRNWQRDYVLKRAEYASVGVEKYWVIDRFTRRMTVFRSTTGNESELVIGENEIHTTPLLPGFELKLNEVLEEADKWSSEG